MDGGGGGTDINVLSRLSIVAILHYCYDRPGHYDQYLT